MSIKFQNRKIKGNTVRPRGYKFPTGLTANYAFSSTQLSSSVTGTVTTSTGQKTIHSFTGSGTFTPQFNGNIELLMVAGGGGGSTAGGPSPDGEGSYYWECGGGGAGGLLYYSGTPVSPATPYTVTVGSGGASRTNGGPTSFTGLTTAVGGGRGGSKGPPLNASPGGSGGGAQASAGPARGLGTPGQGNNGGAGSSASYRAGAGGGGAGGAGGGSGGGGDGASGGVGLEYSISGSPVFYAGGGGGAGNHPGSGGNPGPGGNGGGGKGYPGAQNGTANRGGGAGAGGGNSGGSGIVIISHDSFANSTVFSGYSID